MKGMITVAEFLSHLRKHDPAKPVCFCRCPQGLRFYRFKVRGERLLQLEFNESVYRTGEGRLLIDVGTASSLQTPSELKASAQTVGGILSGWNEADEFELFFGGSEDALKFAAVVDLGEWVSIDFEPRVFRGDDGRFVIEETRDGQKVRDVLPLYAEVELEAFKEEHEAPPSGLN